MRPRYETSRDRSEEVAVAARLAELFGLSPKKLPESYTVDYALIDGGGVVKLLVEVKRRKVRWNTYPTLLLSMRKVDVARGMSDRSGLPALLAVQWDDRLGLVRLREDEPPGRITYGGRQDRRDWQDLEPCYQIPLDAFLFDDEEGFPRRAL